MKKSIEGLIVVVVVVAGAVLLVLALANPPASNVKARQASISTTAAGTVIKKLVTPAPAPGAPTTTTITATKPSGAVTRSVAASCSGNGPCPKQRTCLTTTCSLSVSAAQYDVSADLTSTASDPATKAVTVNVALDPNTTTFRCNNYDPASTHFAQFVSSTTPAGNAVRKVFKYTERYADKTTAKNVLPALQACMEASYRFTPRGAPFTLNAVGTGSQAVYSGVLPDCAGGPASAQRNPCLLSKLPSAADPTAVTLTIVVPFVPGAEDPKFKCC